LTCDYAVFIQFSSKEPKRSEHINNCQIDVKRPKNANYPNLHLSKNVKNRIKRPRPMQQNSLPFLYRTFPELFVKIARLGQKIMTKVACCANL